MQEEEGEKNNDSLKLIKAVKRTHIHLYILIYIH